MSKRNRQRGFEFEREIVNLAKENGLNAQRTWGSDGRSANLPHNVDVIMDYNIHIQCKRQKRPVSSTYVPEENIFAQAIRGDRQEPYFVVNSEKFFLLLNAYMEMLKRNE